MSPPIHATLVYDGDCGFCTRVAARWRKRFEPRVRCVSFDDLLIPEAKTKEFRSMVRFIAPDGTIFGGALAVAELFAFGGRPLPLRLYRLPVLHWCADAAYHLVAGHRRFFGRFM